MAEEKNPSRRPSGHGPAETEVRAEAEEEKEECCGCCCCPKSKECDDKEE